MSLFDSTTINMIKKSAYWADRSIRSDLSLGYIADENDYTSNFTSVFRRQINSKEIPNVTAKSFKINGSLERKTGTDACIILANATWAKICLFEAKLPRLTTKKDSWDYIQTSTGTSHFSSQLARQHQFINNIYIWEMFYCDQDFSQQPSPFFDHLSTCILHSDAYSFDKNRLDRTKKYSDQELIDLHNNSQLLQVDRIIELVCSCKEGYRVRADNVDSILHSLQRTVDVLAITSTLAQDDF